MLSVNGKLAKQVLFRLGTDPEINQGEWLASLGFKLGPS